MKLYCLLLFSAVLSVACHRKVAASPEENIPEPPASTGEIPVCIQQKIDSIKKLPVWNPPASIELYEYNQQKIYVVSADCCDFFTTAYDQNCSYVCAPSGGFTGKGDGLCKDFNSNAKLIKVIWKDDRTKNNKSK